MEKSDQGIEQAESHLFGVGEKVWHIHAKKILAVEKDEGGDNVRVYYTGGKSQFVPRGVLQKLEGKLTTTPAPKAKKDAKAHKARSPERTELVLYMREITDVKQLEKVNQLYRLNMTIDPKEFGRMKMQVMAKLWSGIQKKEIIAKQLWDDKK